MSGEMIIEDIVNILEDMGLDEVEDECEKVRVLSFECILSDTLCRLSKTTELFGAMEEIRERVIKGVIEEAVRKYGDGDIPFSEMVRVSRLAQTIGEEE